MTREERDKIIEIAHTAKWAIKDDILKYLETVTIEQEKSVEAENKRTGAQNRGLHLWFRQIADTCRDAGIDGKLLMSKTISVEVNEHIVKGMWKALQQALFGKESTTELKKIGDIDKLQDHFVRFFGEKLELEIPPFPSDDHNTRLQHIDTMSKMEDYPEYKEPTI